ncbi:uncharacterized protein LOC126237209 [Schistocerca nitens]|uniref:uncharacterized protein LOC126237209 n=1 Tax=Schistocerca nitens TaxID=7011 RepID=UPI0021173E29|nr:uncharacterized protein LOC126237209 [Schistocerca nitens]
MDEINTQQLIALVEQRPVIWDKTLYAYKDRKLKEAAWREVCAALREDFEQLGQKQRQEFGKLALKKWSQTRDSWMKSVKKRHEQKSSTFPGRPSRLYLYHEQMLFLNKVIETSVSQDSYFPQESTPTNVTNEASKTAQYEKICEYIPKPEMINNYATQRKRKSDIKMESDVQMTFSDNEPCREHCGCRHMAFFNSLLPSLSLLDDSETLKFQSEVLSVLQNIKRKRSETS